MAQSKNVFIKGASGKIGEIVTYERNGIQIIREYVIPKDAKSPAQLEQRMKLKVASKGLSPLKNFIKHGHIGNSKAYKSEFSNAMKYYIVGEYPMLSLDYSLVQIAEGKLQLPKKISAYYDNETNTININWNSNLAYTKKPGRPDDKLNVVYFNEKLSVARLRFNAPKRYEGKATLSLPEDWEIADIHLWIYMTSYDLLQNSNSLYLKI